MPELLKALGVFAWLAAGWFIYVAVSMDVSVPVPAEMADLIQTPALASSHAMHIQMMNFLAGAFLTLDGSVLFVGGFLLGKGAPEPEIEV